ncbi:MAG: alpha/beta hydrolase [Janthinobacterium lividum]
MQVYSSGSPGVILLLAVLSIVVTVVISVLTACAVAVRGMTSPVPAIVGDPPAGIGARTVSVPSDHGQSLAGWFAPGRVGHGVVLLLHGIRSDRRALAARVTMLARAGMAVLAIDFRAHGESAGKAITFGHLESRDVLAALAWLRETVPGEKSGAIGVSMGGAALLLASPTAPADAMVLESVYPDIDSAIANRMTSLLGPRLGPALTPLFTAIGMGLTGLHPSWLRPIEALAHYHGPVLILGGDLDRATPPSDTRALYAAAPGPKQLWLVEGAGHVDLAVAAGSDYERRVLPFLASQLQRSVSCA